MSASIQTAHFSKIVGLLSKATNYRSTPILGNILCKFNKNTLNLSATDLNVLISTSMEIVNEDQEGSQAITLPARILSELVSTMDDDNLCVTVDEDKGVFIHCGSYKGALNGISADAFPPVAIDLKGDHFSLSRSSVERMINQVGVCASSDDARPVLQGVQFAVKDNKLSFMATDGFTVAKLDCPEEIDIRDQLFVVPSASFKVVSTALKQFAPETVEIWRDNTFIVFSMDGCVIRAGIVDGNFPDCSGVIPKSFKSKLTMNKATLLMAAKQVLALGFGSPSMVFTAKEGKLSTYSPENASDEVRSMQELEASLEGPDVIIALNPHYLKSIIEQNSRGEDVVIELNAHNTPVKMTFPNNPDLFYIIMPMHM